MASLSKLQLVKYENAVRSLKAVASDMFEHKEDPSYDQLRRLAQADTRYRHAVPTLHLWPEPLDYAGGECASMRLEDKSTAIRSSVPVSLGAHVRPGASCCRI